MIDTRSDQERAQAAKPKPKPKTKPRKTWQPCQHEWGVWMRDMIAIKTPAGTIWQSSGSYRDKRRFCTKCKAEQKGYGSGDKIKPIY